MIKYKVEKVFVYKNHECIILFIDLGYRCGYVSTSLTDNFINLDIDCHWGLTFNGNRDFIKEATKPNYIGFDCGHFDDGVDYDTAKEYELIDDEQYNLLKVINLPNYNPVCSLQYVEDNCKHIVDQLIELEKE